MMINISSMSRYLHLFREVMCFQFCIENDVFTSARKRIYSPRRQDGSAHINFRHVRLQTVMVEIQNAQSGFAQIDSGHRKRLAIRFVE